MEPLLNSLNPAQKEAALCIDEHVRIVAGAGSGKTRVLMARIEYLLNEIGVYPSRILAITFTNKATREMKERLFAQVGQEAERVRISTIHSLCVRILREDAHEIGYPKNFAVLDTADQQSILRRIYKSAGIGLKDIPLGEALSLISLWKRQGKHPITVREQAATGRDKLLGLIYEKYTQEKKSMYAMDFDDLLIEGERMLRLHDTVREKWQNRLDYLHVDEFQDVDPIQYDLIRHLTRKDAVLAVVGDPDQTIYTWRGASVDIILNFEEDFQPSRTILLTENYRSTQTILDASNALISNNRSRVKKDLFSSGDKGDPLVEFESVDEENEARWVVRQIEQLHKDGTPWDEIAILYRSNYISRLFEQQLRLHSIPYRIYGGTRFYERKEIKDILSYLRLLTRPDPADPKQMNFNLAIERIINEPRRGIGAKFMEALAGESQARDINYLEVLREPQYLSAAQAKKARAFARLIDELREDLHTHGLAQIVSIILDKTGYQKMLEESTDAKDEDRLENVRELEKDLKERLDEQPELSLEDYLQDVALFTDNEDEDAGSGVTLMTVHAAKGTEFDAVFVVSVNEDIFPSARALAENGAAALEEERRLMYVAITRARKKLFISWNQGYSFQSGRRKVPSRFVREIPFEEETEEKEEKLSIPRTARKPKKKVKLGVFHPGSMVTHRSFGSGVVLEVSGDVITVLFSSGQKKKIKQSFLEAAG